MTSASPSARRVTRPLIALASVAALALGLAVALLSPRATAVEPLAPGLHGLARGVDSSSWQHPHGAHVGWQSATDSGKAFAFIKATEGTGPANRYYESDVHDARAAGMAVGSYHKARPATDPLVQAQAFAQRIQSVGGPQLPPVLDIEIDEGLNPHELAEWTQAFLDETEHLTGRVPIIYTYRYFWLDWMDNTTRFAEYPLWLAEYGVSEPTLPMIGGWTEWLFWQRSETGRVPGFAGDVDLNVFAGTHDDLGPLIGPVNPGEIPPPAPEPETAPEAVPEPEPEPGPAPEPVPEALPEPQPAPEPQYADDVTVAVPAGLPVPDEVAVPETITVPGHVLDAARAGFEAARPQQG